MSKSPEVRMTPVPPTLRRVFLVRGDGGHLSLVPVAVPDYTTTPEPPPLPFTCPCGKTLQGTFELSGWTTEYVSRCLSGLLPTSR